MFTQQIQPGHLIGFVDDIRLVVVAVRQRQIAHRQLLQRLTNDLLSICTERSVKIATARFAQTDQAIVGDQLDNPLGEFPEVSRTAGDRIRRTKLVLDAFRVHRTRPHRHDNFVQNHIGDFHISHSLSPLRVRRR